MMVIRGDSTVGEGAAAITQVGRIHPADRCIWTQSQETGTSNYVIANAFFVAGNATYNAIANPELGYIGKTGRFVGMTV